MESETVSRFVFEGEMARMERMVVRLARTLILSLILLFLSNLVWLYAWNQYDYDDSSVTVDGGEEGVANYIGANGVITNASDSSQETQEDSQGR